MNPVEVFISYRRDDAAGYARAIGGELARRFGADRVFIDVDDIGAGQTFTEVIRRAVGESKVLLVLMGPRWRGPREDRPARIFDADDLVRIEVATALAQGLRVIPLLLDGAALPAADQLPPDLRPLLGRNAFALDNSRFAADMERLAGLLDDSVSAPLADPLGKTPPPSRQHPNAPRARPALIGLAAALLLALTFAAAWVALRPAPANSEARAPVAAARPAVNGEWHADVVYDWPGARFAERFSFGGEAEALTGSASFLGVPRGLLEGRVEAEALRFVTRTTELAGGAETSHRYRARLVGDALHFTMQTEGGSSTHVPVEFIARRPASGASGAPAGSVDAKP